MPHFVALPFDEGEWPRSRFALRQEEIALIVHAPCDAAVLDRRLLRDRACGARQGVLHKRSISDVF